MGRTQRFMRCYFDCSNCSSINSAQSLPHLMTHWAVILSTASFSTAFQSKQIREKSFLSVQLIVFLYSRLKTILKAILNQSIILHTNVRQSRQNPAIPAKSRCDLMAIDARSVLGMTCEDLDGNILPEFHPPDNNEGEC